MKAMLFTVCLLVSASSFAKECYVLNSEVPAMIRNLEIPKEICVSDLKMIGEDKLIGISYVDGEVSLIDTYITDVVNIDNELMKVVARNVIVRTTFDRGCDEVEAMNVDLNIVNERNSLSVEVADLDVTVGYTMDVCHSKMRSKKLNYKKVN